MRLLVKAGHDVHPLPTPGAERFVSAETFFALARKEQGAEPYPHLRRADLLVIAPLTANTLAKLAHGLSDNVLTEAALAHAGPLLVAPAMNTRMWQHTAVAANVETLRSRGATIVGPEEGELAEGEVGIGRMAEPESIAARVAELLGSSSGDGLRGKRVLVSAGGTREPLDSVRFLGNRSSGRMGVAIAAEAQRRGADVTLLAANLAVAPPHGVALIEHRPLQMSSARHSRASRRRRRADGGGGRRLPACGCDNGKRAESDAAWAVELVPTVDVLRALGDAKTNGQLLVAFGAEHGAEGLERKRRLLVDKNADLVVYNDVGRADIGFDAWRTR